MGPHGARLPENLLFPDAASRSHLDAVKRARDLDALKRAKAKQDLSHRKLDRWIAATIAEFRDRAARDRATPDHPSPSITAKTRGGDIGRL